MHAICDYVGRLRQYSLRSRHANTRMRCFCLNPTWLRTSVILGLFSFHPAHAHSPCSPLRVDETALVKTVVDGDTVRLTNNRLVRLIGINTPEIDHEHHRSEPGAETAREALVKLIGPSRRIKIQYGQEREDRHGRLLAHLFTQAGANIQQQLLQQGLGFWIAVPPNVYAIECYRAAESKARTQTIGIWNERYYSPKSIASLDQDARGFVVISAYIQRVGQGRKNIWLNLGDTLTDKRDHPSAQGVARQSKVALRIYRSDLHYFQDLIKDGVADLSNWQGRRVTVRGWIYPDLHSRQRPPQLVMQVKHPAALEFNATEFNKAQ